MDDVPPVRIKPTIPFIDAEHASFVGFESFEELVVATLVSSAADDALLGTVPDDKKARDLYLQKIAHSFLVICFGTCEDTTARNILRTAKSEPRPFYAAWTALADHFQPVTPMAASGAYFSFSGYAYDVTTSLAQNARVYMDLVRHCNKFGPGHQINASNANIHFLSRLPQDMQAKFVAGLLKTAPGLTFTELLAEIQEQVTYHTQQTTLHESATGFYGHRTTDSGSGKGGKGKSGNDSGNGGSNSGGTPCRNCLDKTHAWTNCPKTSTMCPDCKLHRGAHHAKCATNQAAAPAPTGRHANLAQGFVAAPTGLMAVGEYVESVIENNSIYSGSMSTTSHSADAMLGARRPRDHPPLPLDSDETPWIYDSGASDHITASRGSFSSFTAVDPRSHRLKVGGGTLGIHGVGSISCLASVAGGGTTVVNLRRVLYVPDWGNSNILSASAIKAAGAPMCGDFEAIQLQDGDRLPIHSGPDGFTIRLAVNPPVTGLHSARALLAQPRLRASDSKLLLHIQLGHMGVPTLNLLITAGYFPTSPITASTVMTTCESCELAKVTIQPPRATHSTPILGPAPLPGWRIHIDFKDLSNTPDVTIGAKWLLILTDAATGTTWVLGMRNRSELLPYLKQWYRNVLEHTDLKFTNLHSDNMKELVDKTEVLGWLQTIGTHLTSSSPYTSNENGEAESAINAITTRVQSTLLYCGLPMSFWLLAAQDLKFKTNRLPPAKSIGLKSGFERWTHRAPDISIFRSFGAPAYYRLPPARVAKSRMEVRGKKGIFVGYDTRCVAFKIWVFDTDVTKGKIIVTRNAFINETWRMIPTAAPLPIDLSRPDINSNDQPPATSTISMISAPYGPTPPAPHLTIDNLRDVPVTSSVTWADAVNGAMLVAEPASPALVESPARETLNPNRPPPTAPRGTPIPLNAVADTITAPAAAPTTLTTNVATSTPATARAPILEFDSDSDDDIPVAAPAPIAPDTAASGIQPSTGTAASTSRAPGPSGLAHRPKRAASVNHPGARRLLGLGGTNIALRATTTAADPASDSPLVRDVPGRADEAAWHAAMDREWTSLDTLGTYELVRFVDIPRGARVIKTKWVLNIKRDELGDILKHKARLVALGFLQRLLPGVASDVYSPNVRITTLRILVSLAAGYNWPVQGCDVDTAFLHGEIPDGEDVYVWPPTGYAANVPADRDDPWAAGTVWRLRRSLYGLRRSGRIWWDTLRGWLLGYGFTQSKIDPCLFLYFNTTGALLGAISSYTDDITSIITGEKSWYTAFLAAIDARFGIKDAGDISWLLSMEIRRHPDGGISMSQPLYVAELLKEYNMSEATPSHIPLDPSARFLASECPTDPVIKEQMRKVPYSQLVGALHYLCQQTRPDLCYVMAKASKVMQNPAPEHWTQLHKVLKYLKGTADWGLYYHGPGGGNMTFTSFSDASYNPSDDDLPRCTTGEVHVLNGAAVDYSSATMKSTATSSLECEYAAMCTAAKTAFHCRGIIHDLGVLPDGPSPLMVDNTGAISLTRSPVLNRKTRHLRPQWHYTRELVEEGILTIQHVPTKDNLADIFTKPLARPAFEHLRGQFMSKIPATST